MNQLPKTVSKINQRNPIKEIKTINLFRKKNETHFLLKQENYLQELLVLVSSPITIILVTQLFPIYYLKNKVIVSYCKRIQELSS